MRTLFATPVRLVVSLSFAASIVWAAPSLTITSPASGVVAAPGQSITVTVATSGATFSRVAVMGDGDLGSRVDSTSPYSVTFPISSRVSPGAYTLTAIGVTSDGQSAVSAPVQISIERSDAPIQVDVEPLSLTLPVGERMPLRVIATYANGSKLDVTRSVSTTFLSDSSGVASIDSLGVVTGLTPGTGRITVNNSLSIPVTVPQPMSIAPQWPVLYGGQTSQFSALFPGMGETPVQWSISPQVGSISAAGLYRAPATIPAQQAITITATALSDSTKTVRTGVALYPPIAVAISPTAITLHAKDTQDFRQIVSNALDMNVTWTLSPATTASGSISQYGIYTAPSTVKKTSTVTLTISAIADPTKTATAVITLTP